MGEDLKTLFGQWRDGTPQSVVLRAHHAAASAITAPALDGQSASHVLRLWAFEEVHRLVNLRDHSRAVELAKRYRLVTPVSGAVVLETKRDYDRAGLDPNTTSAADAVPEPATWVLIAVGAILLVAAARKRSLARASAACGGE